MKAYLDYAATSPIKKEVFATMKPYLNQKFGNPSSIHSWGRAARQAIDEARENVAKFLNADIAEVIFASGGSEADNMALRGFVRSFNKSKGVLPHYITTQFEHHAVLYTAEALAREGLIEVTFLKPNRCGIIEASEVKKAIKSNTALVSIMYVNNEVGTVQPIREIGKMIEKENETRIKNKRSAIYFHTDAVQATEYQNMDVKYLHVDMLTLSAHKIGAPKGTGTLYLKKGTPFKKCIYGGEQEMNLRSGTENVAGIVAMGKAIKLLSTKYELRSKNVSKLRDYFIRRVLKEIPAVELNGDPILRSPNNVNFYFRGIEGESILLNLDLAGIAASSGSACTSQSLQPSHVLMAIYDKAERAHGSIRFSLGFATTKEEIDYTIKNLKIIVEKLRAMSPIWSQNKVGVKA